MFDEDESDDLTQEEIDALLQADLKRVDVIPLKGGGYKGTYALNGEQNSRIAIVTPKAPTVARARDAASRWVLQAAAEAETKREWLKRVSKIDDPSRREPEPGPKYGWVEHPEHEGYYQVVRIDTVPSTPCLEPA